MFTRAPLLAWVVAMGLCLSCLCVCLSHAGYCVKTASWTGLAHFSTEASIGLSYLLRNSGVFKIRLFPSVTFLQTFDLEKLATACPLSPSDVNKRRRRPLVDNTSWRAITSVNRLIRNTYCWPIGCCCYWLLEAASCRNSTIGPRDYISLMG